MKLPFSAASLAILCFASPSWAEMSAYGPFTHQTAVPEALFLLGEISAGDSFELRKAMRDHDISVLVTASPGGNLYEGLQIASIVHDNQIGTYVPAFTSCESSCANVFLGGVNRLAIGELGVHQFFSSSDTSDAAISESVTTAVVQYTTADIIGIMNAFDTPPFVYEKMFGTAEIYYLNVPERQALNLGVENEDFIKITRNVDALILETPETLVRPTVAVPSPQQTAIQPQPIPQSEPFISPEDAAVQFLTSMNADWSMPNEDALFRITSYYGDSVSFYGSQLTKMAVLSEKFKFAERWPLRSYQVDPTSVRVTCTGNLCFIESVIFWRAESTERGKVSSGTSTWSLVIEQVFDKFHIISEGGEVISRN